ncbi:hypothetical protein SAMN05192555_104229 [Franzmannia pantelleriensis]|uniref:Uncharacterized protein n=1 Tax=Franzmannia pantelleriensis TaxID=48727 RepID=A0A1G9K4G2_9GAMM|nr:hypothetical protein [Halomonas pantelleriensis]SDL44245.1 hypothetical protein SAMN05192555_104229 [Halomonas pantelleriensis]
MLISDSMPLLWLIYAVLSLVVLATGYMAIRFLPRLPRLVIVGAVAGALWMPTRFRLPLIEEGEFYTGFAPAVVVAGITFLQRDGGTMTTALILLVLGVGLGAVAGVALWLLGRQRDEDGSQQAPAERAERPPSSERREPVIG